MEREFEVGDVVQLKSGGPKMTITGLGNGGTPIEASYFVADSVALNANGQAISTRWDDLKNVKNIHPKIIKLAE